MSFHIEAVSSTAGEGAGMSAPHHRMPSSGGGDGRERARQGGPARDTAEREREQEREESDWYQSRQERPANLVAVGTIGRCA